MSSEMPNIGIILLAGGEGRRMGGLDKGWCLYQETPMVVQVLSALKAQYQSLFGEVEVFPIFISANRTLKAYRDLGQPVIEDRRSGFCGPLAGIEAVTKVVLDNSVQQNGIERWITYPVDSPEVPQDYLERMLSVSGNQLGIWCSEERSHFANLSLPVEILQDLTHYLNFGNRSIKGWLAPFASRTVFVSSLDTSVHPSPFLNLNHSVDLI